MVLYVAQMSPNHLGLWPRFCHAAVSSGMCLGYHDFNKLHVRFVAVLLHIMLEIVNLYLDNSLSLLLSLLVGRSIVTSD